MTAPRKGSQRTAGPSRSERSRTHRSLAARAAETHRFQGAVPPGEEGEGRGNGGDRPLSSKRSPPSATPLAGLPLTSGPPANPGRHSAPRRPRNCSRLHAPRAGAGQAAALPSRASDKAAGRPGSECPAAAQGPPPPRGLSGAAGSSPQRGCGSARSPSRRSAGWRAPVRGRLWAGPTCAPLASRAVSLVGDGAALSLDLEAPPRAGSLATVQPVPGKGLGMFLSPWHGASVRSMARLRFATLDALFPSAPRASFPSGENKRELAFQRCWRLSHQCISLFYLRNF